MKNRQLTLALATLLLMLGGTPAAKSQVLAQWTFNNLLSGLGTATMLPSPATLGPAILGQDYNGGTVFFGEGGWPTGGLDPNAYLEFTVKPAATYSMTVSSMQMNIRRSTTGSGAGPNNWSLRSSLDNYAADISTGVVTMNSTAAIPVTFNSAFSHLTTPVTFRLYGYNVTMTPGGLNRFVFDNISIGGATVLPVSFGSFSVQVAGTSVDLGWIIPSDQDLQQVSVQRAVPGSDFRNLAVLPTGQSVYQYTDNAVAGGVYDYRIALVSRDNDTTYSPVKQLQIQTSGSLSVQGISDGSGSVKARVNVPVAGAYRLTLYNMNGYPVSSQNTNLAAGTQLVALGSGRPAKGIYIIRAENGGQITTGRIIVP